MKKKQFVEEKKEQKIRNIADKMCKLLLEKGFIVQRYDAYSTNSIYLKIDYGLCNSIRISDHPGKKYLNYMYNLRSDISKYYKEHSTFTRYYYTFEQYKRLINHICYSKNSKQDKLGIKGYYDMMNIEKNLKINSKGFWKKAYLVNKNSRRK